MMVGCRSLVQCFWVPQDVVGGAEGSLIHVVDDSVLDDWRCPQEVARFCRCVCVGWVWFVTFSPVFPVVCVAEALSAALEEFQA